MAASKLVWIMPGAAVPAKGAQALVKALVFSGGEIHDGIGCGDEIQSVLEADGGFEITRVNNDLSVLESPNLDEFDVIVFYYTIGDITDAQKNGLLNWIAGGKGYVGIHSAADSFHNSPEYRAMVGGWFVTHPAYRQYQVQVTGVEHPITRDLNEFFVTDEMYVTDYDPRNMVLASSLWKGERMPVAWVKPWGKGRVFWLALGHDPAACRHEMFRLLLARGAKWAAGEDE